MRAHHTGLIAAAAAFAGLASPAIAQLRVVSLNGYNFDPADPLPRSPWADTILGAIGSSVSDDPFLPGNPGIVKPIDILALQETHSWNTTVAGYRDIMNSLYPGANYQIDMNNGASTGAGSQGLVYNANAVQLIATKKVGVSSGSGQPRQALRYQLRPVGYGPEADVYVYNVHYKAGTAALDPDNPIRRNIESIAIRADADALGPNKNIMYTGDFNVYGAAEAAFQTLIAPGNGQAIDPINQVGEWHNSVAHVRAHTQSPYSPTTAANLGTGFTVGATGGMDDRFDFQLLTENLLDGEGLAYIPNSYQAFGNNGTHTVTSMGQPINSAANTAQPREVLDAMAGILDHLPVVADYQLPAKLAVSVTPPTTPPQVIVGGNVQLQVTVANAAPVMYVIGADTLDYTLTATGAASGSTSGSDAALGGGNTHAVTLNTASTGNKSGAIQVSSTSEAVADNNFSASINYAVLDHAQPSFLPGANEHAAAVDFGYVPIGSSPALRAAALSIHNRVATAGFTAALDLDAVNAAGDALRLTTTAATFSSLAAGGAANFLVNIDASTAGDFAATHTFETSDQDLPGAAAGPDLVLTSTARVFSVATFPVSGYLYLPASEPLATGPFSIAAGVTLTKTGPGAMTISGPQDNAPGAHLAIEQGTVTFQTNAGGGTAPLALTVNSGCRAVFEATQDLDSLSVNDTGSVDLRDQKLVLRNAEVGSAEASTYTGVSGLIQRGRAGGAWNGAGGIVTSMPEATSGLTTFAVATAEQAGYVGSTFGGVSALSADDVLVMYTCAGDANLDGFISGDDYSAIDFASGISGATGYANGDFNYDGIISGDDYSTIDFNLVAQGSPFPTSGAAVVAVPEPSFAVVAAGIAGAAVMRLPRRTRRTSRLRGP